MHAKNIITRRLDIVMYVITAITNALQSKVKAEIVIAPLHPRAVRINQRRFAARLVGAMPTDAAEHLA